MSRVARRRRARVWRIVAPGAPARRRGGGARRAARRRDHLRVDRDHRGHRRRPDPRPGLGLPRRPGVQGGHPRQREPGAVPHRPARQPGRPGSGAGRSGARPGDARQGHPRRESLHAPRGGRRGEPPGARQRDPAPALRRGQRADGEGGPREGADRPLLHRDPLARPTASRAWRAPSSATSWGRATRSPSPSCRRSTRSACRSPSRSASTCASPRSSAARWRGARAHAPGASS